jgi:predicted small lipoprotein YifL
MRAAGSLATSTLLVLVLLAGLSGCGQKGPLTLSKAKAPLAPASAATPSQATPAQ